ncbi:hypothetical protein FFLO_04473 [Filobasidium floriforme]|uniref:Glycoside hydrolase family 5 domain-containing protein n=1 Tax=Filobasidium floriforme TaxID=5210 RepID=A0A8K0JK64_9TREE|nr:hypothetical protein FFLO_04473 [Filobasidium floriforme]
MGLLDKFKAKGAALGDQFGQFPGLQKDSAQATYTAQPGVKDLPLGPESVIRFRKQRGVNLGAWFSQEAWIVDEPFKSAAQPRSSDHDIAKAGGKEVLERHWDNWIGEDDWKWIVEKGFNTVRLPIGYYHLSNPNACPACLKKTDFEPFAQIYEGAWPRIEKAIQDAGRWGLGILIDLHGVAGNQNDDAHSGTSSGKTQLWDSKKNLESTSLALRFLTQYLARIPHVVGLQLMNEPKNNQTLGGWYESTIRDLQFVVVDHHLYRCFTAEDRGLSGDQHAQVLSQQFRHTFESWSKNAGRSLIVGEFSAALDPHSFPQGCNDTEKDRQRREFLRAQLNLYEEFCAGWYFWTLKKGNGWDAGWSAKDASTAEILPGWVGGKVKRQNAGHGDRQPRLQHAFDSHAGYWSTQPGPKEHDRFWEGINRGWDDAVMFMDHRFGPQRATSVIGFDGPWIRRRTTEHLQRRGQGPCVWEFEHGWRQGVAAAAEAFLI